MNWQPIETAPKDGSEIVGFWWNNDVRITQGGEVRFPNLYVCWWACGEWQVDGYDHHFMQPEPTHWVPIPAPPEDDDPRYTITPLGAAMLEGKKNG